MATDEVFHLALDLGAESGRALLGHVHSAILSIEELHRFPNDPVYYNKGLHWDVARLWYEIRTALSRAASQTRRVSSIGVDTWGLDFALLGDGGTLLDNPFHYRDSRTEAVMEQVFSIIPPREIYETTGVQFMPVNTLYQLFAAKLRTPSLLEQARHFVMIPDLFNFWLTGVPACEFTNATTTQFFNPRTRTWAYDLLRTLGLASHFLGPVIEPGSVIGRLLSDIAGPGTMSDTLVVAPACHDTGSAVAAISACSRKIFISSGTWSLLGTELPGPLVSDAAQRANFTNEGGVCGTTRLLKNISGLWLVQACRRRWLSQGQMLEYADLTELAASAAPLASLVDPDTPEFLRSEDMLVSIDRQCRATEQKPPSTIGGYVRLILESLALKYRYVSEQLEHLTGVSYEEIRIVGGGARNRLLNQFTANATNKRVVAGPIEATALGNIVMQMLATGQIASLEEGRAMVDRSFPTETFEPREHNRWEDVYSRFCEYVDVPWSSVAQ